MNLEDYRRFYSEEVAFAANLTSPALIEAFARVPREQFLGPGPWRIASADLSAGGAAYATTPDADPRHVYHNVPIALAESKDLNNGQPGTLARYIDLLELKTGDRVFHLGCGVGYYTAIIAEIVGSAGSVTASEVDTELAERARTNLESYPTVRVLSGDGGAMDPGVCDAILINAGVTHVLELWLDCLADGGRLAVPLTMGMGPNLGKGMMVKVTRSGDSYVAKVSSFVMIYSCTSVRDPQLEPLLGKAMGVGMLMNIRSIRRDAHEPESTCVVHRNGACLSSR